MSPISSCSSHIRCMFNTYEWTYSISEGVTAGNTYVAACWTLCVFIWMLHPPCWVKAILAVAAYCIIHITIVSSIFSKPHRNLEHFELFICVCYSLSVQWSHKTSIKGMTVYTIYTSLLVPFSYITAFFTCISWLSPSLSHLQHHLFLPQRPPWHHHQN